RPVVSSPPQAPKPSIDNNIRRTTVARFIDLCPSPAWPALLFRRTLSTTGATPNYLEWLGSWFGASNGSLRCCAICAMFERDALRGHEDRVRDAERDAPRVHRIERGIAIGGDHDEAAACLHLDRDLPLPADDRV